MKYSLLQQLHYLHHVILNFYVVTLCYKSDECSCWHVVGGVIFLQ